MQSRTPSKNFPKIFRFESHVFFFVLELLWNVINGGVVVVNINKTVVVFVSSIKFQFQFRFA